MLEFKPASREQVLLRMALIGPAGSGKTLGALRIASALGGTVAVIDTEKERAKLYADRFDFLHAKLVDHSPEAYRDAVRQAAELADVVVVDSFSHEWLEILTQADKFGDWKTLTPRHREFVEAMTDVPAHLIVTMRAKMKYGVEEVEVPGRDKPRQIITRLGVGPVQREGVEYEFDVIGYLDTEHVAAFTNRCDPLVGTHREIDDETCGIIVKWLAEGDPPPPPPPFDPAKDLLPGATQFKGRTAMRQIAEALNASAPHVDWGSTLNALVGRVYGVDEIKRIPRGDEYVAFTFRLANAVAKMDEFSPAGSMPPVTDEQIVEAFAFAFDGDVLEVVLVQEPEPPTDVDGPGPDEGDAAQAEAAAGASDAEASEMAEAQADMDAQLEAAAEAAFSGGEDAP